MTLPLIDEARRGITAPGLFVSVHRAVHTPKCVVLVVPPIDHPDLAGTLRNRRYEMNLIAIQKWWGVSATKLQRLMKLVA